MVLISDLFSSSSRGLILFAAFYRPDVDGGGMLAAERMSAKPLAEMPCHASATCTPMSGSFVSWHNPHHRVLSSLVHSYNSSILLSAHASPHFSMFSAHQFRLATHPGDALIWPFTICNSISFPVW